jgi:ankyrin repeat protein
MLQTRKALGWTPLHFAAQNGEMEICKLILENITEKNSQQTYVGKHQKAWRLKTDMKKLVKLLIIL